MFMVVQGEKTKTKMRELMCPLLDMLNNLEFEKSILREFNF